MHAFLAQNLCLDQLIISPIPDLYNDILHNPIIPLVLQRILSSLEVEIGSCLVADRVAHKSSLDRCCFFGS